MTSAMPARAVPTSASGSAASWPRRRPTAAAHRRGFDRLALNVRGGDISFNPLVLSYLLLDRDGVGRWFVDTRKLPKGLAAAERGRRRADRDVHRRTLGTGSSGRTVLADPAATHVGFLERLDGAGAKLVEADDPCVLAKAQKNPVELRGATTHSGGTVPRLPAFWPGSTGSRWTAASTRRVPPPARAGAREGSAVPGAQLRCRSRPTGPTPPCRTTG